MKMIHEQASRKITFLKKITFDWKFSSKRRFVTNLTQRIVTNLTGYSKKFLTPYNGVREQCQSERLNFLEKVDYNIFLTLTGVWYRSFSRLSFRQFLWIHSGTLQGKLPPSLSPQSCTISPHPLPPTTEALATQATELALRSAMKGTYFDYHS